MTYKGAYQSARLERRSKTVRRGLIFWVEFFEALSFFTTPNFQIEIKEEPLTKFSPDAN
jgi:hypothetical protein